jgi:glycosyltransferase involved in cell wall biosynthesis
MMQVVLSTIGRFHTFDLARQLHKRNALKTVFSGYPLSKLRNEGLPGDKVKSFPWLHGPYMFVNPSSEWIKRQWSWQDQIWFDRFVAAKLPNCDIFHGLSAVALRSGRSAKKRGAKYVCDRECSHIRFQNEILREEHDRQGVRFPGVDPRVMDNGEAEYDLADAITVPSQFVRDSFLSNGISERKINVVPYGVELARFRPVSSPPSNEFRVLFAGSISVRKGIPYLFEAYQRLNHPAKRLVLAGGVQPAIQHLIGKMRARDDVTFTGHLSQEKLIKVMSESHVLVLPSVEEGLAYVQAQAMACGCPVIASTNTGARDLFEDGVEGFIVPIRSSDAIAQSLQKLADDPDLRASMSRRSLARVNTLGGWDRYGDAMTRIFQTLLNVRTAAA